MGKKLDFKIPLVALILFIILLSQLIPVVRVGAASISGSIASSPEFFTGRSDYCAGKLSNCDGLLQHGLAACVYSAANSGNFYTSGDGTNYNNEQDNYKNKVSFGTSAYELLANLFAYYYGVNVPAGCNVVLNTSLPSSEIPSLDNIGAAFDILSMVYGQNVPNSTFSYQSNSSGGNVTLLSDPTTGESVINKFVDKVVGYDSQNLVCDKGGIQDIENSGMDISTNSNSLDIGQSPKDPSGREMIGLLKPSSGPSSCQTGMNIDNFTAVIDKNCGNISALLPAPPDIIPPVGTCSIIDSANGSSSLQPNTPDTFSIKWTLPNPQATEITSANVTQNSSTGNGDGNHTPNVIANPVFVQFVGWNSSAVAGTVDPAVADTVTYSGSMIVVISGTATVINCGQDTVSWTAPLAACLDATLGADVANTNLVHDENVLSSLTDAYNAAQASLPAARAQVQIDQTNSVAANAAYQAAVVAYTSGPNKGNPNILLREQQDYAILQADYATESADEATVGNYTNTIGNYPSNYATDSAAVQADNVAYNTALAAENAACNSTPSCPPGYSGTYPNCYIFIPPPSCPPGDTGIYPNCISPVPTQPVGPESYFTVSGGDTITGTGFGSGSSCTDDLSAGVVASNIGGNPWTGASDNLASLAPDIINGLSTGSGGSPLTFANTVNSPYGGSFGSTNGLCSQDYYSTRQNVTGFSSLTAASGTFNLSTVNSNATNCLVTSSVYYCKLANPVQISGNPSPGISVVLYVSGSAEIAGNISIYSSDSSALTTQSSIPSLYIISNGNIYIDSGVTSIDGVYVADNLGDSDKTNNGIIFTCASSGSSFSSGSALISSCNSQLSINGALVANQIKFGRTYGDITSANGSAIAPSETINYGPEVWLSQIGGSSLPINPVYQDITELSPVI